MIDYGKLYDEFLYDCYIANQRLTAEDWFYYGKEIHHIEIPARDQGVLTLLNSQPLTLYQHWIAGVLQSEVLGKCCFAMIPKGALPPHLDELCTKWRQTHTRSAWENRNDEERSLIGKKAADSKTLEQHQKLAQAMNTAHTTESRRLSAIKGAEHLTQKVKEDRSRAAGKAATRQRWQCTVTGKVSCAAPLTRWQRARGIDPSNRVRRYDLE